MKKIIIIVIAFLTVISGFSSCLRPVKPADNENISTAERLTEPTDSVSNETPEENPLEGIVFDYRPLDEFVRSLTLEKYFDKVYGVVDEPPANFFTGEYNGTKLGKFYSETWNEDYVDKKDHVPLICLAVKHLEISKEEFVRLNEEAKENRNDMPVTIYSDEEIEYIFGDYDDETVMRHLKAPTAFYHDGMLYTIYDLEKLDDQTLKGFYGEGDLDDFFERYKDIINGITDYYKEKYSKEFAEDEYYLWGTMYSYRMLYKTVDDLQARCSGQTAETVAPPVDLEKIINESGIFEGIIFDYRPFDDIISFSGTKKHFDSIYLEITEGGIGPEFPEEYMEKFREVADKWEKEKRYFENDRLPLMYYIIKETGISRDEFVRINEEYKVKKLDDLSIGYPVYTDEEIEYFFGDYDKNTAMEHLKAPTAFYYEGRLYTVYDLEKLDDSVLKQMLENGGLREYLELMKEIVDVCLRYCKAKFAGSYYLPQYVSGYNQVDEVINGLIARLK